MIKLVIAFVAVLLATSASAVKPGSGVEEGLASLLRVESTDPVIHPCGDGWSTSCFRIVLRITARGAGQVRVGHIPTHRDRRATAFSGSGASCAENGARGLPDVVSWSSGTFSWREPPALVTADRPATLLLAFGCDGQLAAGDEVNIDLALAVETDGRNPQTARSALPGLQLVTMPGTGRR